MTLLSPAASRDLTLPVPLEPDIERMRGRLGNTTTPLCSTLIGQIQRPAIHGLSPYDLNCSVADSDVTDDVTVSWWMFSQDPVYYLLPVVLITGIVADTFSACLLARLLSRTPTRCHNDVTSDVYLLWLTLTCDLWLVCVAVQALPDYVTCHVMESLQWAGAYLQSVIEWLSYSCLWLLITMSLNTVVTLSALDQCSPVRRHDNADILHNSQHHQHHQRHDQRRKKEAERRRRRRRRQNAVCAAIQIICLISTLPQFFAVQLVDSWNVDTNRTSLVSQFDERLTLTYEYVVVYHWYVVCLTVLLPLPLLLILGSFLTAALMRTSSGRVSAKSGGRFRKTVTDDVSAVARRSSSPCCARKLNSIRLHVALIVLYLLFTCPRSTMLCVQGVFVAGSGRTSLPTTTGSDVIYAVLESVGELAYSVYQASWLPLLASYHDTFRQAAVRLLPCYRCRGTCCCERRRTAHLDALTTPTPAQCATRKSVTFDMQTMEFEIQY